MAAAEMPDVAQCTTVAAAVKATVQQQGRKQRLPWRRLSLDILSVLCGLRPTAILDYAVVPREFMLQLAATARSAAGPAGQSLVTAEHEGVMYFLHAPWLLRRLTAHAAAQPPADSGECTSAACSAPAGTAAAAAAAGSTHSSGVPQQSDQHPRFVVFDEAAADSEDTVVRWVTGPEQQAACAQLQVLHQPLQRALAAASQPETHTAVGSAAAAMPSGQAADLPVPHLVLDQTPGLPLLPTLNGWLLGYPVVYLMRTGHEVDVAARHLSGVQLLHCAAYADCRVEGLCPQVESERAWLYAFTLPTSLGSAEDLQWTSWMPPREDADADQLHTGRRCGNGSGAAWSAVRRVLEVLPPRALVL